MAIGLPNGHSILFDLDTASVRQWTLGEFAKQRTVGKSWYWDMAGVDVMSGFGVTADIALKRAGTTDEGPISPEKTNASLGRLRHYAPYEDGVRFHYELDFAIAGKKRSLSITETILPLPARGRTGWQRYIKTDSVPENYEAIVVVPQPKSSLGSPRVKRIGSTSDGVIRLEYDCSLKRPVLKGKPKLRKPPAIETVTTLPGYTGQRLPIDASIMPTAFTWTSSGTLAFTSLKGHVYLVHDSDGDGLEDRLQLFEEGLASPYGIIADGDDLIVAHKPELLRLRDTDGDGRADVREVVATGWGYSDNYHDWTCGIIRDSKNRLYVGLGSDYSQPKRPKQAALWRGKVLRIDPGGKITPVAHSFRYPTGLAINSLDEIFITDKQGMQNCFNEINFLIPGSHYGVASRHEEPKSTPAKLPAIQVPHRWTRSVNGIFFLPKTNVPAGLGGHGIGCEFNHRFLVRFTHENVNGTKQGAIYPFSRRNAGTGPDNFLGPLSGAVAPNGDIYIGSIHDSGWLGGRNTGSIVRLKRTDHLPNGIREVRATPKGFQIEFFGPVDEAQATQPKSYNISAYQRVWQGGYSTPDSGRHKVNVTKAEISNDSKTVTLTVDQLRTGFVYEVYCSQIGSNKNEELWPTSAYYTMHNIPQ